MIKVIVVDDERIIRKGIIKIIRENISQVQVCAEFGGAQECLAYLETTTADLLLTDIRMPGIDGIELLRIIRQRKWKMDVIVLSGYNDFDYCRAAIQNQVHDYLLKPIDKEELIGILKRYVANKGDCETTNSVAQKLGVSGHQTVKEIKKYIRQNFEHKITMEELSNRFFLNPNYISQLFKKEAGVSISTYITDLRMEMACMYLNDCTKRIMDISQLVGYANPGQFAIAFKKKYDKTPSEYRKERGMPLYDEDE